MTYLIMALIIILDQWLKLIIRNNFYVGQSIPIIKNIFHLTYVQNTGVAFGILQEHSNFFIILSLVFSIALLAFKYYLASDSLYFNLAIGLIIGGALGNLIDRVRLGYVVDYLDFRIWPIFNLADSAVVIGVGILILFLWYNEGLE